MVIDTSFLKTQQYKVRIKGKEEQFRERCSILGVVAIEKGAFWSPSIRSPTLLTFIPYSLQTAILILVDIPQKLWLLNSAAFSKTRIADHNL